MRNKDFVKGNTYKALYEAGDSEEQTKDVIMLSLSVVSFHGIYEWRYDMRSSGLHSKYALARVTPSTFRLALTVFLERSTK